MQSKYGIQGKIQPLTKPGRLCRLRRKSVDGPEQYCCDLLIHRDFCGPQESEFAQGRFNNAANRCYYACFQAAVVALHHAGLAPRGGRTEWGHALVQAEFVRRLIHRRRLYSTSLRQVLGRNLTLRHTADYAPDLVTQTQAARALQRTQDFLAAIREQVRAHERGTT
jgi:uncharacterized protein (UPF0332 family)